MVWTVIRFNEPPFNLKKLEQLKVGMAQTEVRDVLGDPSSKYEDSWVYSSSDNWPMVYIFFDAQGKMIEHRYDY